MSGSALLLEIEATKAYCFPSSLPWSLLYLLHQASGFQFQDLPLILGLLQVASYASDCTSIKNPFTADIDDPSLPH